ncbi:hypothetical protein [Streptomyces marianii]|uniref:Uncharacterized protein n=1 Tax=Streptomyces marianii TaxID=1817406 RepID=A0A5R9DTJ4_9ACTN|nr:hypothetical protein [Streptomyces marianii]TLQ39003.1 hypothetical protein FEF34_40030 [Streptomyces marianii]
MEHSQLSDAQAAEARRLIADAYRPTPTVPTSYRDTSPVPAIGDTPPVPQPGRPPMSQRATDVSGVMLAAGAASLPIGGSVSLVLYTLGHVDPVSLAIGAGAPVAFVAAIAAALRRLQGVHTEHHHHYSGTVVQDHSSVTTKTRGLIARTNNDLRR